MKNRKLFLVALLLVTIILSVTVSAARLPTVGGDNDAWGTVLNNFLNVSLNDSGELRNNSVSSLQIVNDTITDADISDETNLTLGEKLTFTLGEVIDNIVNGWITITGSLNVTENVSANWFIGNLNWSDVQNVPQFAENDTAGWNLTFLNIRSDDWTNVTITESQIGDLQPYLANGSNLNVLDVNASSATIHGDFNVTGTSYLGDITIASDNLTTNGIVSKDGNITFYNGSGREQVRITQEGRLGVGVSNPSERMNISGNLGVSGNVTSTYFLGNGSQLTSLTESQINDLVHTINGTNINVLDVNGSSSTIHGDLNVTGTSYLTTTGIDTTGAPRGPLHVVVPNNAIGLYIENSGGTSEKKEFSIYGNNQELSIGAYADAGSFIRGLITFDHDGGITLPNLGSVEDVRHVCATAAGVLELKDGACSGSSRRFKENEKSLNYGIDELMLLRPKFFNYKTHSNITDDLNYLGSRTKRRMGLMAEDVFDVLPEVVVLEDGVIDSIDYSNLIPLTIKAIQEQQVQIDSLALQGNFSLSIPAHTQKSEVINSKIFPEKLEKTQFKTNGFGQAIISAGDKEVQIIFETVYENIPIVTLTPLEFIDGKYKLSEKTTQGFKIVLEKLQPQNTTFDWSSFAVAGKIIPTISKNKVTIK